MHDGRAIDPRLQEIRGLGIQLAIDDFGTGYSSLGYLHQFPIDRLKIDKLFIDPITEGPRASALARAVIQLGDTLGLSVVAEGVESRDQAHMLREMGCALAQGYVFSRPVDDQQVEAMLEGMPFSVQTDPATALQASARPA